MESFYFVEFHSNFFKFEKNCQIKSDKEKQFEFLEKFSIDIIMENFDISQPDRAGRTREECQGWEIKSRPSVAGVGPVGLQHISTPCCDFYLSDISRMLAAAPAAAGSGQ